MSQETTLTVRTYTDPDKPERDLSLGDLRWLVAEADRLGLPDTAGVQVAEPIVGGNPSGWGLTLRAEH